MGKKTPSEVAAIIDIFKSLDWARPENSLFFHPLRIYGTGRTPEGFKNWEWHAITLYLDYSTKAKPVTNKICQILCSDVEMSPNFRGVVALIVEGRLSRGKQSKVTTKDRDLWVYLAISYIEENSAAKYPRERLYEAMIEHIERERTAVMEAFTNGQGIFKSFDARTQELFKFQFVPQYWESPEHGQFDAISNRLVY
ncbi:MAG: hypothetical protein ABL933_04925 [Methyloglobulus sp.]|nr:hypothetical protein [Methyloglobulus sp.]